MTAGRLESDNVTANPVLRQLLLRGRGVLAGDLGLDTVDR